MVDSVQKLFAFVLMPFDACFEDLYRLGIKEPAAKLDVIAERVDEQKFTEPMLERIYRQIEAADVVIAEMTGQNPNVFYEVGYAHAREKLCILSTATADDIPFDLKHRRHIVHSNSILTLGKRLTEELAWARGEIERRKKSPLRVTLSSAAQINRSPHWDEVELTLTLDLHNDGNAPSPELEAIYLFSASHWTFKQDGQDCPRSDDTGDPPMGRRHFIRPPVRKLVKGGWAQARAVGTRTYFRKNNEQLPDNFPIKGRVPVEFATSAGTFVEEFRLDLTAEEFPF